MRLYYAPGACSLAPHIVLRDTQLSFGLVKVDLAAHRTEDGTDYYAVNSKGGVPVLELDNGDRLTEGPIIAQYVADRAGREDLMPKAGSIQRYHVQEWQNYITSELHKSFSPLFNSAFDAAAKTVQRAALRKKYQWVSSELMARPFIAGNAFSAADAYLFTVTRWSGHVQLDLSDLDPLQDYLNRISLRPAVQLAMRAEGLIRA